MIIINPAIVLSMFIMSFNFVILFVFLSESESVHAFIVCLYMYYRWRTSYQEGRAGSTVTDLIPPYFISVPSQDLDLQRYISWSLFCV
jgi:hypothetical protein